MGLVAVAETAELISAKQVTLSETGICGSVCFCDR